MKRIIQIVFIMAALGAGAVYYQANQILNIVNRNSLHCKPIYKGSPEKLTEKVKAKKIKSSKRHNAISSFSDIPMAID